MTITEFLFFTILLFFITTFIVRLFMKKNQYPTTLSLRLPPSPWALPIIGHLHLLSPLIHHSFRDLSSKYGPLMYLKLGSVPCVVVSSPDFARELLKTKELTFSSRNHTLAASLLTYNSSLAFSPYGPYWKFIKKLSTSELVGARALQNLAQVRTKELENFIGKLLLVSNNNKGEGEGEVEGGECCVNMTQELLKLSNNMISQMMFSVRISSGTDTEAEEVGSLIREVSQILGEFNVSDFIGWLKYLNIQGFRKRSLDIHHRYDAMLEKIITARENSRKKRSKEKGSWEREDGEKDWLGTILDALEDNKYSDIKLTRNHIKALILDFLTAGTDTTAIATEWALAEVINNPIVLKKAREEIKRVVGDKRLVCESDVPNLPYIQALMKETFRLHPPIPFVSRKSVEDCLVRGYIIPAGSLLFVNVWSIGRDPKYWDNPMQFMPERFLEEHSGDDSSKNSNSNVVDVKGQHFQLLPFGTGRRGCPGMTLALQEVHTILAAIIQCFDLKVVHLDGGKNRPERLVDMSERPGLTAPRAHDLVCVPIALNPNKFLN